MTYENLIQNIVPDFEVGWHESCEAARPGLLPGGSFNKKAE